jgi:hypothetical protein
LGCLLDAGRLNISIQGFDSLMMGRHDIGFLARFLVWDDTFGLLSGASWKTE